MNLMILKSYKAKISYLCIQHKLYSILTMLYISSDISEIPSNALFGLSKLKNVRISNSNINATMKDSFRGNIH